MKRLIAWCTIVLLLLTVCGCKREMEDGPASPDSVVTIPSNEAAASQPAYNPTSPHESETSAKSKPEAETKPSSESEPPVLTEEPMESDPLGEMSPKPSVPESGDCGVIVSPGAGVVDRPGAAVSSYDPDAIRVSKRIGSFCHKPSTDYRTYSDLMEWLGKDGLIAAGYATGIRKSVIADDDPYEPTRTRTQFKITDLYWGTESAKAIQIDEPYVLLKNDRGYYLQYYPRVIERMKNNQQVLVFLQKKSNGIYQFTYLYEPIPLMQDYRKYNESYLKSVLAFFRGDTSVYNTDAPRLWPKRDISDKNLLAEMSNHLLLQVAINYKIALWPYGHKNYNDFEYFDDNSLVRFSLPLRSDENFW